MWRRISTGGLALAAVLLAWPALAQGQTGPPAWGYWHHDGWGWGHMLFGSLMMLVFWGGLILVIVLAVRYFGQNFGNGERSRGGRTALRILEERFARGEIDQEEFEKRKRALTD